MNRLSTLFNVRPNEKGLVALFVQYYFLLAVGFVFIQVVAFALFVATYGPQKLPFAYMSVAIMGSLVMLSYLWLSQRLPFARLLVINLTFLVVANMVFWIALNMPKNGAAVFLLPAWFQSSVSLGNLAFWGLAGRVFDVRQGKRLFGLIGAGNWLAVIISGFLVAPLISLLGTYHLLLLGSISIGAAMIIQFKIVRRYFKPTPPPISNRSTNKPSIQSLLKSRYIMLMFGLVIIWWLGFYFVDNIFFDRAAAQYPDTEELANVIGNLVGAQGVLALITSFFLTSWIIGRFGLRGGLLVLPICLTVAIAGLSLIGTIDATVASVFWLAAIAKLVSVAFGFSLDQSARIILYQPLPDNQRVSAQTLADGIVLSLAIGLAGVFLLLFNTILKFRAVELSYLFLGIGVAWITIVVLLAREYRLSLVKALKNRYLSSETAGNLADRACVDLFREQLRSAYPEATLYAINMLDQMAPEALSEELPTLLAHPSAEIRREALMRTEKMGRSDLIPEIQHSLEADTSLPVREAALRTLASLGGTGGVETAVKYLDDTQLRRGALIGLLSSGGLEGIMIAGQRLTALSTSTDPQERMLAAQILGEIGIRNFYQPLVPLLADPDPLVRREALIAAGKLNHRQLWPTIITALDDNDVHRAAQLALITGGEGSVPAIQTAFHNPDTSPRAMIALARACAAIRGEEVVRLLRMRMDFANTAVRTQILRALSASGYRADDSAEIQQHLTREAEWAEWLREARRVVGNGSEVTLLSNSLDYELAQTRERIFYLLSFIYDPQTVLQVRYALSHGSTTNSAYALEILDMLLEAHRKELLLPILDPSRQQQPTSAQVETSYLSMMLRESRLEHNAWIHTCVLYALGLLKATECREDIVPALQADSPLVRETAQWALSRMNPSALSEKGNGSMLSTIETVLILKTVGIFASIPDNVLAEIAGIVEEQEYKEGETIIKQGDLGDSMYIIINGKVRVHQNDDLLNYLGERDVFGEMALLDPEPRVASVSAVEDTKVFRLGQEPFSQLLDNYSEVARGIIRVLTRYLRARIHDVAELHDRIEQLEMSGQAEG